MTPPEHGQLPVQQALQRAAELERRGLPALARGYYERLLRRRLPDDALSPAALLRRVGSTYRAEGDTAAAADCFQASLAAAECADDAEAMAHALNWLGVLAQEHGRYDEAARTYAAARQLAEQVPAPRTTALILQNLAVIATLQGDRERALDHHYHCLRLFTELGDHAACAPLQNNLGMLLLMLDRHAEAAAAFDEAAAACDRAGDPHTRAMVEVNRAELHYSRGEFDVALGVCRRAQERARQIDHRLALGESYRWLGAVQRELGELHASEACLEAAGTIARQLSQPLLEAQVQRELGLLFRRQERHQEALQALNRAHAFFTSARAAPLLADVDTAIAELESVFLDIVQRWGDSIERKDHYTSGHCQRVADYACRLARAAGYDGQTIKWFRMGALLHDVGKIAIPSEVLNKPGPLTPDQRTLMQRHTVIGEVMLAGLAFPWDIRPMIRNHHERWDGAGYPDGLAGEAIPEAARILCIADVYDALTSPRSYRPAYPPAAAVDLMRSDQGQFDPRLFALFEGLLTGPAA